MTEPETFMFDDDGAIPNSTLPLLVYRAAVRLEDNRSKGLIAAGNCETAVSRQFLDPDEDADDKTNVPRVQVALSEAIDDCADKLRHDPLGIYGSAP